MSADSIDLFVNAGPSGTTTRWMKKKASSCEMLAPLPTE
jgi:hypothetical protein